MLLYRKIRKSIVRQRDKADCGVACLQSVLLYYDLHIHLEQLRNWSGTQRTGTTMLGIIQAAEKAGLEAEGYAADLESLRACRDICILHVLIDQQLSHYLVYWGYDEKLQKYIIGNPSTGSTDAYSARDIDSIWESKFLIVIKSGAQGPEAIKAKSPGIGQWMYNFVKPDLTLLGMALLLGTLVAVLGLSTAVFSQKLLDDILPSGDRFRLFSGIALLCALLIFRSALGFIRQLFLIRQAKDFSIRTIDYFINALLALPKSFFDNRRTGDMVARMNDTTRIQVAVTQISANALIDALLILSTIGFAFYYQWQIGLLLLSWLPIYGWIAWRYYASIITGQQSVMHNYAHTESTFVDTVQGAGTIKLFNRQNLFAGLVRTVYAGYQGSVIAMGRIILQFGFWTEMAGAIFISAVLLFSAIFTLQGSMTVGMIIAVLQMTSLVVGSAARLNLTHIQLQEARVAFGRMQEFTALQPEYRLESDEHLAVIDDFQELRAEDLAYHFPGRPLLLEHLSLSVRKGELVLLTGETGSGKSTLLQIFQKFYPPGSGQVLVNEVDLAELSTFYWRNCLGVVEQETSIFDGTLADNIVLGEVMHDLQPLRDFLARCGLDTYFAHLPQGIATLIGKEGMPISGGQKQLLGLARALWKKPQLLLLDEPTAALDQETEQFVLNLLHTVKRDMGILLLTHRKAAECSADRVYRINNHSRQGLSTQPVPSDPIHTFDISCA